MATRVESVWKASSSMSYISRMWSSNFGGMPGRRVDVGVGRLAAEPLGAVDALFDLADAGQVLVELAAGRAPPSSLLEARGVVEDEVEDRPLLLAGGACRLARRSPGPPAPKSRSKTSRGFGSGGTGVVGERQDRLYW